MKSANATKFDRKFGVAERRDLQFVLMEKRNPEEIRNAKKDGALWACAF